jgi:rhamnosyltransferase
MKLSAVVVFYKPSKDNISNIDNYIKEVDKLYVVDNTDDDVTRMESTDKIKYIKLGDNKGIAYALNVGAKKAIDDGYKYLLTLDQDSKMNADILKQMKDYLKHNKDKKVGLISPYQDIDANDDKSNKEVEDMIEVMTSGNIIDLEAYQIIGGFKDWLFIDCVDTDYCMNLHKHGYKVLRLNNVVMKHELGNLVVHKLFGKEYPCYNHNPMRRYYIVRNNLYINDMYKDLYPDYCAWLLRVQKGQVKRIIAFEKNKFKKLRMMFRGYRDYKKGIKGKLK